jgi:hypothetical protein
MTRDSEVRKCKVLGEEWFIEIDYFESGAIKEIGIWDSYDGRYVATVKEPYELEVIGKNLIDIGKELSKLNEEN